MKLCLEGYEEIVKEYGLELESYFIVNSFSVVEEKVFELLCYNLEKIVIVCVLDWIVIGVVCVVVVFGCCFGENIVVIGFDGVFLDRILLLKIIIV